jgi:predicted AlkP superfamily pyrophosphatase or phosphodiesterase
MGVCGAMLLAGRVVAGPVVLISIDGLMPEVYLQPDRVGASTPNLRGLVREGAAATGVLSVMPSITFPAHTSAITGVSPRRHGVLSNEIFDPDGKLGGGWYWYASDVKARTLFDAVHAARLRSAAVTWPATAGAPIDLNLPDLYPVANLRAATNLLALARLGPAQAALPSAESLVRMNDEIRVQIALRFLDERPDLFAVHFLGMDDAQHTFGPRSPQAVKTLEQLDAQLGVLFDRVRAQGRWDETTVVVMSDHGFAPVEHEVRVGMLLRTLGLLETDREGKVSRWRAFFWPQGGSGALYLHSDATAEDRHKLDDVIRLLQSNPAYGVGRVFRGPEVAALGGLTGAYAVLDALPGFCFGRAVDAPDLVGPKPGGTHGYHPARPEMKASFVVRGPGIRRGALVSGMRLVDVAPTLARILGVELGPVEGRVVTELFEGARRATPDTPSAARN